VFESYEKAMQELRATCGPFYERARILQLDLTNVPEVLQRYAPFAEFWGIADDLEREELVVNAPGEAKTQLVQVTEEIDDLLDEWLCGPEADSAFPSAEYIAFSAMRMAADFV